MPKDSVNLYLSIQSGSSEHTLVSLTDKTRALDKETQLLKQATEALAKANKPLTEEQVRLQAQTKASQKTVNELQKAYAEQGDELSKLNLDHAIEEHAKLKAELSEVNAQLGANQKTYKEYLETVRKGTLSDTGGGGASDSDSLSLKNMAKGLVIGQVGQMFSSSLGGLGQAVLTSMIGTPEASLISDALSNAISGGAAGAMFGPWGIAAGAALGGLSGLISGGTKIFEARDDAFKDYYGGLYQDVSGRSGAMVGSGSFIAGRREQTLMAFSQRLGGDDEARTYLAQVEKMAASTNYEYDEIVGYAKLLLNSYAPDEVFHVLSRLSDATAGLNLNASDVNVMISGLSRMRTTGKATQEYLNYFRERGVDVDQALADDLGVEKSAISGMVTKGEIGGEDAAQAILDFLGSEFGGLSDTLAGTYDAMVDNLGDINASLEAAGGDAYNAMRKEGIQAEMDAYGGELGDAIKEINAVVGENQARLENLQDQYMREVLDAVLNGNQGELWSTFDQDQQNALTEMSQEFARWSQQYEESGRTDEEAGAQMESLYEQAQVLGQAYFDNSDLMKTLHDVEEDEVEAIRQNTAGLENAYTATYNLSQVMSRGLIVHGVGGYTSTAPTPNELAGAEATVAAWRADPDSVTPEQMSAAQNALADSAAAARRNAFGLDRVPYDDYPALLHEGERVLTAAEARAQDAGNVQPLAITITGNSFTGTPEDMAFELAQIILQRLTEAGIAAAPK